MENTKKWIQMDESMDDKAKKEALDGMWCMLTGWYAKEVLKTVECYGYSELYYWNLIDLKMKKGDQSMVTVDGFATDYPVRLPTKDEMWKIWTVTETNEWNLNEEQMVWWK